MNQILLLLQTISALVLTGLILIQAKGTGLGKTFAMGSIKSFSRRGLEKVIFKATFFVLAIFLISSLLQLI